jgi:hypothetical protein
MTSKLDNLLPAIIQANHAGLTVGAIRAKFIGKSNAKAKDREVELREKLASLARADAIWGPVKHGVAQYYFATGVDELFFHQPNGSVVARRAVGAERR